MAQNFIESRRDQGYLLPPDVRDWLPVDHLAWFVIDAVGQMDLAGVYGAYRADGHGADWTRVLSGSGNLTAGGLDQNHEQFELLSLRLPDRELKAAAHPGTLERILRSRLTAFRRDRLARVGRMDRTAEPA